jgi:predicted transcriptional regulator
MLLATTMGGGTKMKIMSKAHLNNNQMKPYISSLVSRNLIKEKIDTINQSSLYQTTEKGRKFLETYREGSLYGLTSSFRVIGKN